ncbi:50S ribosomal protein L2 [Candidatus Pacearchaeota archaeon]|nr:50S ribosomal protein L2 [Candidatus Pacearchaeota archaeon]
MAKRIISQARGKGSGTYRVRRRAYRFELKYPARISGEGTVVKLQNSIAHTAPLAKIVYNGGAFYMPAFEGMIEGQKIKFDTNEIQNGNIVRLKDIPVKTQIYDVESRPGDGGIFIKTAGSSAIVTGTSENFVQIMLPSKKEKKLNPDCRAVIGIIAGSGRLDKPFVKAGKKFHLKKSKGKLWPRTSAVKVNAIDHPFGSGRGKRPKSKIAKRNAPPGARVGHLRPRRTGRKKR